jgi:hypothetical protein
MKTDDLIRALEADARATVMPQRSAWRLAAATAVLLAAGVFFATIGPRPDITEAAHTVRFLFKFVATIALAASAFAMVRRLSIPGASTVRLAPALLAAPLLMATAVVLEMAATPAQEWLPRLVGRNMVVCLTFIPLIGAAPLALFVAVLRHGAPTRPGTAGAVAGLAAGGLAATFYAAHCTDDSPLFVASWYTIAIAALALVGALAARRLARW